MPVTAVMRQAAQSARNVARKCVCVFMAIVVAVGMCPGIARADASDYTKSSVLSTLKAYDSNGYYIVKTQAKRGDNIMAWWNDSNVYRDISTTVHEECHAFSFATTWNAQKIYVGNKKSVKVKYTKTFKSQKIASTVPSALQTERFWTYVGASGSNLDSNVYGAYGLLNEFMAYCWGFNSLVGLYGLANKQTLSDDVWLEYYAGSANAALAYAEFRYFIQHYLYYAKKNKKSVYKKIVKNKAFVKAVKKIDKKYNALIKKYDSRVQTVANRLWDAGYQVYMKGDRLMMGEWSPYGYCMYLEQYNAFAKELKKSRYKAIQKKLGLTTVKTRALL